MIVGCLRAGPPGRYVLQAAIASLYAEAPAYDETDWPQIVALYDRLLAVWPSPIVALNRTVPLAMVAGPQAALAEVERLETRRAAVGVPVPARDQGRPAAAGSAGPTRRPTPTGRRSPWPPTKPSGPSSRGRSPGYWRLAGPALATMAASGGMKSATTDMITAARMEKRQITVQDSTDQDQADAHHGEVGAPAGGKAKRPRLGAAARRRRAAARPGPSPGSSGIAVTRLPRHAHLLPRGPRCIRVDRFSRDGAGRARSPRADNHRMPGRRLALAAVIAACCAVAALAGPARRPT